MNVIFLLDALYASSPVIKLLKEYEIPFIISVKPTKRALFRQFKDELKEGLVLKDEDHYEIGIDIKKQVSKYYEYSNDLLLSQDQKSEKVNLMNFKEIIRWVNKKGEKQEKKKNFSYITDIALSKKSFRLTVQGGRTRWKIENETFNTLKNQGYFLEHNYGHGKSNLSLNFINSMFLAFFMDQVQQASCQKFKRAMALKTTKVAFWNRFRSHVDILIFNSWEELFERMAPEISSA